MKRIIALLLAAILLFTSVCTASAAEIEAASDVQSRWSYLETISAYLNINALGVATCSGFGTARSLVNVKVTAPENAASNILG
jgi:outer membrane lipoprotein-sorting protein